MHVLGMERTDLYLRNQREVSPEEQAVFDELAGRRLCGEPVAYLVGRKEFWSLDLSVEPSVLIPRPETEVLVEEVLQFTSGRENEALRIADVGTGSGAVALALAVALKEAHIFATDISQSAIAVALRNVRRLRAEERVSLLTGDMLEPLRGDFDCIVSNPPYLSEGAFHCLMPDVREYEPKSALVAGPEGTEMHRRLISEARGHLGRNGRLFLEIDPDQKAQVERCFLESGCYGDIRFRRDYGGRLRVASAARM